MEELAGLNTAVVVMDELATWTDMDARHDVISLSFHS